MQRDDAVPRPAPREPHPQPSERERAVSSGSEAQRRPRGRLVGDHQLPGSGHARRSLPPFPTDQHASHTPREDGRSPRAQARRLAPVADRHRGVGRRRRRGRLVGAAPGAAAVPRQRERVGRARGRDRALRRRDARPRRALAVAAARRGRHAEPRRRAGAQRGRLRREQRPPRARGRRRARVPDGAARAHVEEGGARHAARRAAARHRGDPHAVPRRRLRAAGRGGRRRGRLDPARDRRVRGGRRRSACW